MADLLPGQNVTVEALFFNYADSTPENVTDLTVRVTRLADGVVIQAPTSTGVANPTTGQYLWTWAVPADAVPGTYLVYWLGTDTNDDQAEASQELTVVLASDVTTDMLATVDDLAALTGETDIDVARATLALEAATAVVQSIVGQRIVQVVNDQVTITVDLDDDSNYLVLPEGPVTQVTLVQRGGSTVTGWAPQLSKGRLYHAEGWRNSSYVLAPGPTDITVTYTHGYPLGHHKLQLARAAVLSLASGAYSNPSGASRETIDDYSVAYDTAAAKLETGPFLMAALRRQYGRGGVGSVKLVASRGRF